MTTKILFQILLRLALLVLFIVAPLTGFITYIFAALLLIEKRAER